MAVQQAGIIVAEDERLPCARSGTYTSHLIVGLGWTRHPTSAGRHAPTRT
jgi:hypothetical protein